MINFPPFQEIVADDQPATEGHEGSKGNIYIGKLHFEKGAQRVQ